jgi:hypothetical protein
MKKTIRLTESDLTRLVKRVIQEQAQLRSVDAVKPSSQSQGSAQLRSVDSVKPSSQSQGSAQLRSRSMTGSDKMMDAVKPSSLTNLVNQSQGSAVKPTSATVKPTNSNLKSTLEKLVGVGTGKSYQEICKVCNQQTNLDKNNPRAKKAAREFAQAIKGLESTFSNFGGSGPFADKDSSAFKAGQALEKNLENAEDICTTIKYYNSYGGGEEFCEAVRGEQKYTFDNSTNEREMIGNPISRILNRL